MISIAENQRRYTSTTVSKNHRGRISELFTTKLGSILRNSNNKKMGKINFYRNIIKFLEKNIEKLNILEKQIAKIEYLSLPYIIKYAKTDDFEEILVIEEINFFLISSLEANPHTILRELHIKSCGDVNNCEENCEEIANKIINYLVEIDVQHFAESVIYCN